MAAARGNEKGRVERAIRYIRDNFFAGRTFTDLEDINAQAHLWCTEVATQRRCPGMPEITVAAAFAKEQPAMQSLPDNPFDSDDAVVASVGKTPYIRYDLNDYSVPHTCVQRPLSIRASQHQVRVYEGATVVATHSRHYGKGEQIEDPQHIEALKRYKGESKNQSPQHRLYRQAPASEEFLQHSVKRGHALTRSVHLLNRWLNQYGGVQLQQALQEALTQSCYHTDGVLQLLERQREQLQRPVPLSHSLPNKALDHPPLTPASLVGYDRLHTSPASGDRDNDTNTNTNTDLENIHE